MIIGMILFFKNCHLWLGFFSSTTLFLRAIQKIFLFCSCFRSNFWTKFNIAWPHFSLRGLNQAWCRQSPGQGRRKVWKSGGASSYFVGIICPLGWDTGNDLPKSGPGSPGPPWPPSAPTALTAFSNYYFDGCSYRSGRATPAPLPHSRAREHWSGFENIRVINHP